MWRRLKSTWKLVVNSRKLGHVSEYLYRKTQTIDTFNWGVSDRGASIRIPWQVDKDGKGYLEDRRPSANCDPYLVAWRIIKTVCGENK